MSTTTLQRVWPIIALILSAAVLGAAHAFETFGGYAPCELCLRQREIYWAAIGVAVLALVLVFASKQVRWTRLFDVILGLVFLTGAVVAGYHAGVEWKFWPGPATCSGGATHLTAADILSALTRKGHPPSCEDAAWRLAGLSMAGYNVLISAALAGASFLAGAAANPQGEDNG